MWQLDVVYIVLVVCYLVVLPAYLNEKDRVLPDPPNSSYASHPFYGGCDWNRRGWDGPFRAYLPPCVRFDLCRGYPSLREAQLVCQIINENLTAG